MNGSFTDAMRSFQIDVEVHDIALQPDTVEKSLPGRGDDDSQDNLATRLPC